MNEWVMVGIAVGATAILILGTAFVKRVLQGNNRDKTS